MNDVNNKHMGEDDLMINTSARLPVCLCLDTSGSMAKDDAIEQLNKGIVAFYETIRNSETASVSCEIAIVTFNSEVTVVEDFSTVDRKENITLTANGGTALAHGVEKSLDLLEERKRDYKLNGIEYYQPWLVIITDGKPGDPEKLPEVQARTKELIENKKLVLWPIAVGSDEDTEKFHQIMKVLDGFSPVPKARHLKDLKFEDFFEWLGGSVDRTSVGQVGDKVKLDSTGIDSWSEI